MIKISQNLLAAFQTDIWYFYLYNTRYVSGTGNRREVSNRTLRALRRFFVFMGCVRATRLDDLMLPSSKLRARGKGGWQLIAIFNNFFIDF